MVRKKTPLIGRRHTEASRRIPILAVLLGLLAPSGFLEAYRFFSDGRTDAWIVGAKNARRWSAEVWGPGATLGWEVAPDPDFEVYFDSPEGVLPYVERALAAWSDIPTADIQWQVDGVGEGSHEDVMKDNRNTVSVDAETNDPEGLFSCAGKAYWWNERSSSGRWALVECDIALCAPYAEIPEDVEPDFLEEYRERRRERSVYTLVHEFGHCLGLLHAGAIPTERRWSNRGFRWEHPKDPAMSYGWDLEEPEHLSADDVVGASLLRPASGSQRTGSIAGSLDLAGDAVPFAHVWALPVGDAPLRDRVGAFSDREGAFLIEGLPPGDYALWAQPIFRQGANLGLVTRGGAPTDLDDTVSGRIFRVRAGRTTGDVAISMRRGRIVRAPPEAILAQQDAKPPTPITGDGTTPCSGVHIRSVRPYPAGGPLWHTARVRYLRGDRWFATSLTMEWSPGSENTVFDWVGSYRAWRWDSEEERAEEFETEGLGARSPVLDVNIPDYRIERDGSLVRHTIEIAWPESTEASLRFRSEDNACDGEPMVVCNLAGCELRR